MKKTLKISVWLFLLVYLIGMSAFVSKKHNLKICNKVNVIIADSVSQKFIDKKDIIKFFENRGQLVLGEKINSVNTMSLETTLLENNLIESCSAYYTVDGKLHIEVFQKCPIARIIDKNNNNYYIDKKGDIFQAVTRSSPHVVVVSGNIKVPKGSGNTMNIFQVKKNGFISEWHELYHMISFVNQNPFWRAQIEQVYKTKKGEYELVPRIGPHIITLGDLSDYEHKFWKLKTLYEEGLNRKGWNQYLYINLKYKDQVVCTKI
ncbi:MAG: hypothetical protein MI922_28160 [Bacteroidales bacterium]|nr:hypothetical protein [Bacteroidales bacterium]